MYNKIWYNNLNKSQLSPPNQLFGIVWPILYMLMTVSFILFYYNCEHRGSCSVLYFFFIQLFLNLIWTTIFFKFKKTKLALLDLFLTFVFTLITYYNFSKISRVSGYLLIPYILWLSFAIYLNSYIVLNN